MRSSRNRDSGFTLFEVMMAMGVFVFLVGGIYFAVSASVSTSIQLGETQMEARRQTALVRFLREGFLNLPSDAEISLLTRDYAQRGYGVELVIERASGAFETGVLEKQGSGIILGATPDGRGTYSFVIQRFISGQGERERGKSLETSSPLVLLGDVGSVKWRFWDKLNQKFVEEWDRPKDRPEFIEFAFSTATDGERTSVFRLPIVSGRPRKENAQPKS